MALRIERNQHQPQGDYMNTTIYLTAAISIGVILAMLALREPDLTECEKRYSKQTCEHYAR